MPTILDLPIIFGLVWLAAYGNVHVHATPTSPFKLRAAMLAVAISLSLFVCYGLVAGLLQDKLSYFEAARSAASLTAQWTLGLLCQKLNEAAPDRRGQQRS
jgi:hypothetical protein